MIWSKWSGGQVTWKAWKAYRGKLPPTEEEAIWTQKFSDLRKNDLENTDYVVAWLSFAAMIWITIIVPMWHKSKECALEYAEEGKKR